MKRKINAGICDFCALRRAQYYYVDKTDFIEKFCEMHPAVGLFTRPRRFGKSLHLNMLHNFFDLAKKDAADCFEGLKVSRNKGFCEKWMHQHPVLKLSFHQLDSARTFEEAKNDLVDVVATAVEPLLPLLDSLNKFDEARLRALMSRSLSESEEKKIIKSVTQILEHQFRKKVIVLIDEYDMPLRIAADKDYYDDLASFMRTYLGMGLKDNDSLEFGILTGCLRIAHESMFSGLNNFTCFDIFNSSFADVFGFTDAEVDQILDDFDFASKKRAIKEWYDGYLFGNGVEMYSPWDISSYMSKLAYSDPEAQPESFWTGTALVDVLHEFLRKDNGRNIQKISELLNGGWVDANRETRLSFRNLYDFPGHMWLYMANAGYLTQASKSLLAKENLVPQKNDVILTIPNLEIRMALRGEVSIYLEKAADGVWTQPSLQPLLDGMLESFSNCDGEGFSQALTDIMLECISYHQYDEKFYLAFLGFLLKFSRSYTLLEKESGEGRADIIVVQGDSIRTTRLAAIIEIKKTADDSEASLEKAVEAALNQIEDRKYDAPFRLRNVPRIVHWGIAFQRKHCLARARVVAQ